MSTPAVHADHVEPTSRASSARVAPVLDVVVDLERNLADTPLPLELEGAAQARLLRDRVRAQITSHLLPRLRQLAMPAIVVVGGSTGAGKSTLVNTVAGEVVSEAGVLRPTTKQPVLVVHPDDRELVADHPVVEHTALVTAAGIPQGVALLDAPDLDSVHTENRHLGLELVETADLWLFVTTAARYGDALPWGILRTADERGVSLAVVLNRVSADVLVEVRADLLHRLDEAGFGSVPMFVVPDAGPHSGPLEPRYVEDVVGWLELLAGRATGRGVIARTLRGVWAPLRAEIATLTAAVEAQLDAVDALAAAARAAAAEPADALAEQVTSGGVAEGAPVTHWLAVASSGAPLAPLVDLPRGRLAARRLRRTTPERTTALRGVAADARQAFIDLVGAAALDVELRIREAWDDPALGGRELAARLTRSDAVERRGARIVAAWDGWVGEVRAVVEKPELPHSAAELDGALLDDEGRVLLVALAAVGIEGAARAARAIWPDAADVRINRAATLLVDRARTVIAAEGETFGSLAVAEIPPDAASALRLRASELRAHA
ncbi:GTPase domain-containing protein [Beutenbergia cavernae]|uniref:GTPase domain-containing protein n=1 Tax=Beutenbergia cavernae TaxID=84757 RepID=UPI00117E7417|nr:GTPase domain-containing protein [Beutenbergia cavernae]